MERCSHQNARGKEAESFKHMGSGFLPDEYATGARRRLPFPPDQPLRLAVSAQIYKYMARIDRRRPMRVVLLTRHLALSRVNSSFSLGVLTELHRYPNDGPHWNGWYSENMISSRGKAPRFV